jgi:hypothetical protein
LDRWVGQETCCMTAGTDFLLWSRG